MALSNPYVFDLAQIDRAFEFYLRQAVVEAGYWPDPALYVGQPRAVYDAAIAAIKNSGKEPIEIFGTGAAGTRGKLTGNRVLIKRLGNRTGDIGLGSRTYFEKKQDNNFRQMRSSETTEDIEYEVRFVCDDTALDRILSTLTQKAFGNRKWLNGINPDLTKTENGFMVVKLGGPVDLSGTDYIERLWRYNVKDVVIIPDTVERDHVPAAREIIFEIAAEGQEINEPENVTVTFINDGTETTETANPPAQE